MAETRTIQQRDEARALAADLEDANDRLRQALRDVLELVGQRSDTQIRLIIRDALDDNA